MCLDSEGQQDKPLLSQVHGAKPCTLSCRDVIKIAFYFDTLDFIEFVDVPTYSLSDIWGSSFFSLVQETQGACCVSVSICSISLV